MLPNIDLSNFLIILEQTGTPKILELLLDCQGHDSERTTDSTEMMDTGYSRNFITVKKGRFNIIVDDDPETGTLIFVFQLCFLIEYTV